MRIYITKLARENRAKMLKGISVRHSLTSSRRVSASIRAFIYKLPQWPRSYPYVETRQFGQVHRAVIDGLTIIIYRINPDTIEVLNITDGRADWQ